MKDLLIQIVPSLILQAAIIVLIAHLLFWYLKRSQNFSVTWQQVSAIALAISVLAGFSNTNQMYQTRRLLQSFQFSGNSEAVPNPLNQKAEFLTLVDQLAGSPDQINDETRKKIFAKYKSLFPTGLTEIVLYRDEIKKSYTCHAQLFQDLLEAIEKKEAVKSLQTQMCETYSGEFYNRPKLYTDDVLRDHQQAMKTLAQVDKAQVTLKLQQLKIRLEGVDKIFH
jgi:hypothetical protein